MAARDQITKTFKETYRYTMYNLRQYTYPFADIATKKGDG